MNNKEVWLAFTTLSDAQTLLQEFNDIDRANDEINHAKIHLGKLMDSWSTQERTDAMTGLTCTVQDEYKEFLINKINLGQG